MVMMTPPPFRPVEADPARAALLKKHEELQRAFERERRNSLKLTDRLAQLEEREKFQKTQLTSAQETIRNYQKQWTEVIAHDKKLRTAAAGLLQKVQTLQAERHELINRRDLEAAEVAKLQRELELTSNLLTPARDQIAQQQETVAALNRQLLAEKASFDALQDKLNHTLAAIEENRKREIEINDELGHAIQLKNEQESRSRALDADIKILNERLARLSRIEAERDSLLAQTEIQKKEMAGIPKLRAEIERLSAVLRQKSEECDRIAAQASELDSLNRELTTQVAAIQGENGFLKGELENALKNYRDEQATTSRLTDEVRTLQNARKEAEKTDEAYRRLLEDRAALVERGNSAYAEMDGLTQRLKQAEEANSALLLQIEELNAACEALELEKIRFSVTEEEFEQDKSILRNEVTAATEAIQEREARIQELGKEVIETRHLMDQLSEDRGTALKENRELSVKIEELQSALEFMRTEMRNLSRALAAPSGTSAGTAASESDRSKDLMIQALWEEVAKSQDRRSASDAAPDRFLGAHERTEKASSELNETANRILELAKKADHERLITDRELDEMTQTEAPAAKKPVLPEIDA